MKTYVAFLIALILTACGAEEPAQYKLKPVVQEEQKAEDTTMDLQKLTPYLKAVNRTWGRIVQSCWDSHSKTLLAQFPPTAPAKAEPDIEYLTGWQIVDEPKWKEMGNGTQLFMGYNSMLGAAPDTTGIPCVMKDMVNK